MPWFHQRPNLLTMYGSISTATTRYFTEMVEGNFQYATFPEITVSGDFQKTFLIYVPSNPGNTRVIIGDDANFDYTGLLSNGGLRLAVDGAASDSVAGALVVGSLNLVKVRRIGAVCYFSINGPAEGVACGTGDLHLDRFMSGLSAPRYITGVFADFNLYTSGDENTGTLARSYAVGGNSAESSIVADSSGNSQDGVLINSPVSELYTRNDALSRWENSSATKIMNIEKLSVSVPAGFEFFTDNHVIYQDNTSDFDITAFRSSGVTFYVSPTGSDSNDGLTPETSLLSPLVAANKPLCDVVVFEPGRYQNGCWGATEPPADVSFVCDSGVVELLASNNDDSSSFIVDGANPGAYKWSGSGAVDSVWDELNPNSFGGWGWLVIRGNAADVANLGGWYADGVDLWIRLSDDREPDSDVRVNKIPYTFTTGSSGSNYYKNIRFLGSMARRSSTTTTSIAYYDSCHASYTGVNISVNAGFNCTDGEAYYSNCKSYSNYLDAFSLRGDAKCVEIDCEAYDLRMPGSNNGSTTHTTSTVVRIGGDYHDVEGDCLGDTGSGGSYNKGVIARNSGAGAWADFRYDAGLGMWLIDCNNTGTTSSVGARGAAVKNIQGTSISGSIDGGALNDVVLYM